MVDALGQQLSMPARMSPLLHAACLTKHLEHGHQREIQFASGERR
jgi:hypothetical protein